MFGGVTLVLSAQYATQYRQPGPALVRVVSIGNMFGGVTPVLSEQYARERQTGMLTLHSSDQLS